MEREFGRAGALSVLGRTGLVGARNMRLWPRIVWFDKRMVVCSLRPEFELTRIVGSTMSRAPNELSYVWSFCFAKILLASMPLFTMAPHSQRTSRWLLAQGQPIQ